MDTKTNDKLMPIALFAGLALIAGAVFYNGQHPVAGTPQVAGGQPAAPKVNIKDVKTAGEPFIGNANAPVTIAFWSDFQCPYCKAFETGGVPQITVAAAMPDIMKNYVQTGKAKIVFKDFAFLGNDSNTAGQYARSIWKLFPDTYFTWRTAMYKAQDAEGDKGFGNASTIDALNATISGIDVAAVIADVKANGAQYQAMLDADKAEAAKLGVSATPSFIIGTQLLAGAYPYAQFETAINTVLGK
jgi:protein-disulfide isomerase